jgi:hypothetical protein
MNPSAITTPMAANSRTLNKPGPHNNRAALDCITNANDAEAPGRQGNRKRGIIGSPDLKSSSTQRGGLIHGTAFGDAVTPLNASLAMRYVSFCQSTGFRASSHAVQQSDFFLHPSMLPCVTSLTCACGPREPIELSFLLACISRMRKIHHPDWHDSYLEGTLSSHAQCTHMNQ